MKCENLIIYTSQEFEEKQKFIQNIFNLNQKLPFQVFNKNFKNFNFEEFEWTLDCEFWEALQQLGRASNDTHIIMAMLEPNPVTYFFEHFDYYPLFKVPLTITAEEYSKIVEYAPPKNHLDALLYSAETLVWAPRSQKWAIWGQRKYGCCILAFADEHVIIPTKSLAGKWRPVNAALEDFIDLNFKNQQIPQDFARALIANYFNK